VSRHVPLLPVASAGASVGAQHVAAPVLASAPLLATRKRPSGGGDESNDDPPGALPAAFVTGAEAAAKQARSEA
jgi:hypothetical protein